MNRVQEEEDGGWRRSVGRRRRSHLCSVTGPPFSNLDLQPKAQQ